MAQEIERIFFHCIWIGDLWIKVKHAKIFFSKCFLVKFLVNPWIIPDLPTFTKEILNRKVNIFYLLEEIYLWHPIKYVTESIRIQENIVLKAREFNQITLNLSMGTIDIQFWVILKRVTTTTQPHPPPPTQNIPSPNFILP